MFHYLCILFLSLSTISSSLCVNSVTNQDIQKINTAYVMETSYEELEQMFQQIENSYYCDTINTTEKEINDDVVGKNKNINKYELNVDELDIDILEGGTVDPSSITEFYESEISFRNEEAIEEFEKQIKDDGLYSTLKFDNTYWAIAKRNQDSKPSTAIISNNKITQLCVENNGEMYNLNLNNDLKNKLSSSNLNLDKTKAYFALLAGFAEIIVFDDGENELIQINGSYHNIIEKGSVFTIDELISEIDKNINELTLYENIVIEGAGTDKQNAPVG